MMQSYQLPAFRSFDGYFTYTTAAGWDGRCHLQVFEPKGALPIAIACELPGTLNTGPSITNAASALATQLWQQLLPRAREGIIFIEAYVDPFHAGSMPAERFAEVIFQLDGNRLHSPRWAPIERATIEAMIGGPLFIPVRRSY